MTRARDIADIQDNAGGAVPPFVAGKNKFINGDFGIWARGTSFSANNYTADRWRTASDTTCTTTQQTFTPGTAPVAGYEGQFFLRQAKSAGGTYSQLEGRIEDVRTFANQTVTLSFWAKADSAITFAPYCTQNFGSGGSATVDTALSTIAITTSWARYSISFTVPSISGKTIGTSSYLQITPTRFASGSAATIDVWGVQLEAGSIATPFTTATGTIQGELAACQRYYYPIVTAAALDFNFPVSRVSTTLAEMTVYLPAPLRTTPTLALTAVGGVYGRIVGFDTAFAATVVNVTSVGLGSSPNTQMITLGFTNATMTAAASGASAQFDTANAASTIALSAEL